MDDLISRQAAIEAVYKIISDNRANNIVQVLKLLPSAQERKKGKWEVCNILDYAQRPSGRKILRCPFCGYLTDEFRPRVDYYRVLTNFCPNCGAEMSKGEQDG